MTEDGPQPRRKGRFVCKSSPSPDVGGDPLTSAADAPIVVQSMTNTDTADVEETETATAGPALAGSRAPRSCGSRFDRNAEERRGPENKRAVLTDEDGRGVPIGGEFHYIGHKILADHRPAEALDKYRINPGTSGFKEKKDRQLARLSRPRSSTAAGAHRRGIAARSIRTSDGRWTRTPARQTRATRREVTREARRMVAIGAPLRRTPPKRSALADRYSFSAKVSVRRPDRSYGELRAAFGYALHLGLTEGRQGSKGIVASGRAALSILLQQGIG